MTSNPNAAVAGFAGALTVIIVWIVGVFHVDIPAEVSSAFTTILVAGILFVGRKRTAPTPPAPPAPPPPPRAGP